MKTIVTIAFSVAFLAACNSFAKDASKANPFNETLAAAPAAELPAQAANLVAKAKARDWHTTTVSVVKSAVGINPAAAPAIVGAIARAVPEMASVAAGTAAAEQPKQASAIAKAAAAAAPSKAGKIVAAVCAAVPNEFRSIAAAVSEAAPGYNKDIVKGVAVAMPDLKPGIDKTLAGYGGSVASVPVALDQAASVTPAITAAGAPTLNPATPASMVRGPSVGPPYIGPTKTPTNVTTSTSGTVPTGGRNYAAP